MAYTDEMPSAKSTTYPYRALRPEEFRTLEILSGCSDEPIKTVLRHASFDKPPSYHALSYCWGSPEPPGYIECDGIQVRVTESLHDALRNARRADQSVLIWADAVCINQKDPQEKVHQVSRMRDIYLQAQRLFIWFGNPADQGDAVLAMTAMTKLKKCYVQHMEPDHLRCAIRQYQGKVRNVLGAKVSESLRQNPVPEAELMALGRFFLSAWFTRVWIYQEAALFPGNPETDMIVAYGSQRTNWDTVSIVCGGVTYFRHASDLGLGQGQFPQNLINLIQMERGAVTLEPLGPLGQEYAPRGTQCRFCRHMVLSRTLNSSDPRDKIFAFFGLLGSEVTGKKRLELSYEKAVASIYADAMLHVIEDESCLDILELIHDQPPTTPTAVPNLPSWVNDWTQTCTIQLFPSSAQYCAGGSGYFGSSPHAQRVKLSQDGRELGLQVYLVGKMRWTVPPMNLYLSAEYREALSKQSPEVAATFGRLESLDNRRLKICIDAMRYLDILARARSLENLSGRIVSKDCNSPSRTVAYRNGESLFEAFWRTMVCNLSIHVQTPSVALMELPYLVYHNFSVIDKMQNKPSHFDLPKEQVDKLFDSFWSDHTRYTVDRRFCVTDTRFMGWVPHRAQVGDTLCVIPGARMPYVIRRAGDKWEMVGHAYVHGLMENIVDDSKLELTTKGRNILGKDAKPVEIWLK